MLNVEKLQKLYTLATGKTRQEESVKESVNVRSKSKLDSISKNKAKYKGLYSDPYEAWVKWYRDSEKDIDSTNSNEAWSMFEKEFPGSSDQAKDWLRNDIRSGTDEQDPSIKEIKMRNRMTKAPSWVAEEMLPDLAQASSTVSSQNMSKVRSVYKKTLQQKLMNMNLTQLDPEVPVEVHVEDAVKLELLGLLDTAKVMNGRFVTANSNGTIKPAFSLDYGQDDVSGINMGPEADMIKDAAMPIIESAIRSAVGYISDSVRMDNKAATGAALQMLKNGDLDISEWKTVMPLVGDMDGLRDAGISGMMKRNPFMDDEEMRIAAIDMANMEGDMA